MPAKKRKIISGSLLATAGFLLSPLSWWNDAAINLPLAYLAASLISMFYKPGFNAAFIGFYWATNILGLILMHKGACRILNVGGCAPGEYLQKRLLKDLLVTLCYTAVIVILLKLKIIQPVGQYFSR